MIWKIICHKVCLAPGLEYESTRQGLLNCLLPSILQLISSYVQHTVSLIRIWTIGAFHMANPQVCPSPVKTRWSEGEQNFTTVFGAIDIAKLNVEKRRRSREKDDEIATLYLDISVEWIIHHCLSPLFLLSLFSHKSSANQDLDPSRVLQVQLQYDRLICLDYSGKMGGFASCCPYVYSRVLTRIC